MLFLEFYYNLSDVEIVKQLKFNILFRYFVGLTAGDPIPEDTSVVVFRKRLGEERFERILDDFVKQCKKKGILKENRRKPKEKIEEKIGFSVYLIPKIQAKATN